MGQKVLFFVVANVAIFATLVYLVKSGQLVPANVVTVGAICVVAINALLVVLLRRRRA